MKRIILPPAAAIGLSQKGIRTYRDTYKDLNRQKDAKFRLKVRLLKQQDFKCLYCDCDMHNRRANIEHIVPVKRGGTNDNGNLAIACGDCNRKKGNKMFSKMKKRQLRTRISELRKQSCKNRKAHAIAQKNHRVIEEQIGYELFQRFTES